MRYTHGRTLGSGGGAAEGTPREFSTITELYDAADNSELKEGDVCTVSWTGDTNVADGTVVTRWDGSSFNPHPLLQTEVPPSAIGQEGWSLLFGSSGDLTFDADDRPIISPSNTTVNDDRLTGGVLVRLDSRMAVNAGSFLGVRARVQTDFKSSLTNEDRAYIYLTDPVTDFFCCTMMKYFSGWISINGKDEGTYSESFFVSSSYDSGVWEGFYTLRLDREFPDGGTTSSRRSRSGFEPIGASSQPRANASQGLSGSFEDTDLVFEFRITEGAADGSTMKVLGLEFVA